tara:strand:- start:24 stop:3011 length:2988 start_codon:yes stop_codon:yes gene_type:complete
MGSDLTYAVVGGILETILQGYDARDAKEKAEAEAAAKAAEKSADNLFTNKTNFVAHMSKPENAAAAATWYHAATMPNSNASFMLANLDDFQKAQIQTAAMAHMPQQIQSVLTTASKSVESARALARDQNVIDLFNTKVEMPNGSMVSVFPTAYATLTAYASQPLSAQEQAIINGAPKTKDVATQIAYYESQKSLYSTGTAAGDYLDSLLKNLKAVQPPATYSSVSSSVTAIEAAINKEIDNAKTQEREPSFEPILGQIRALKNLTVDFAINTEDDDDKETGEGTYQFKLYPQAVEDHLALDRLEKQIVSGKFGNTVQDIQGTDWLATLEGYLGEFDIEVGTGTPGLGAKKGLATIMLSDLDDAGFDINDYTNKEDEESIAILGKYRALQQVANIVEEVANNQAAFVSNPNTENERTFTFKLDMKDPLAALQEMNSIGNVGAFFNGLPDTGEGSKAAFLSRAEGLMTLIMTGDPGGKDTEAREAMPDVPFDKFAKNLFKEIPGFADIVTSRGFPMAGDTITGFVTTRYEQPADSNVFALNAQYSFTADAAVRNVAAAYGKTPQAMFLTNDVVFDLVKPGEADPLRAFKAVDTMQKSGIFTMGVGVPMSNAQAKNVAMTFARNNIFDISTQVDVIAASIIDPKLPEGVTPEMFSTGFTLSQMNAVVRQTLGQNVDYDVVSKAIVNHRNFLTQAEEVEGILMGLNINDPFTDSLTRKLLNVFDADAGLIASIGRNIRTFVFQDNESLFAVADMRVEEGGSAIAQRKRVMDMAQNFVRQKFKDDQAELATALVTLAYNYAKTMDPSGRISERDFQAALQAVSGGETDNVGTRLNTIRTIIRKSRNDLVYNEKIFKIKATGEGNNRRYRLSRPHLQRMQALTHYRPLLRVNRGMDDVRLYKNLLNETEGDIFDASGNFSNPGMASRYVVSLPLAEKVLGYRTDAAGNRVSIADENNIRVLRIGDSSKSQDFIPGVTLFVDFTSGQIVPNATIQQLRAQGT